MATSIETDRLPNEILSLIIDVTHPDDLVNLVCSQRRVYSLATSRLHRHRELNAKYSHVILSRETKPRFGKETYRTTHPAYLLWDIMQEPFIAFYIRSITFNCWHDEPWNDEKQEHDFLIYDEPAQEIIRTTSAFESMRRCNPVLNAASEDDKLLIEECMGDGDVHYCAMLLLSIATNIQHFRSLQLAGCQWLESFSEITEPTECFKKLTKVEFDSDRFHTYAYCYVKNWLRLPAIDALHMRRARRDHPQRLAQPRADTLTRLEFCQCALDGEDIADFVSVTTGLRHLAYRRPLATFSLRDWKIDALVEALDKHAKASLETLLLALSKASGRLPSLQAFTRLRKVYAPLGMLPPTFIENLEVFDMPTIDLRTMFPPSIASLTFSNQTSENTRGIYEQTYARESFIKILGPDDFPKLKLIEVQTCGIDPECAQAIERAGIALRCGTMFRVLQDIDEHPDVDTDDDDDKRDEFDNEFEDDLVNGYDGEDETDEDDGRGKACEHDQGPKYVSSATDGASMADLSEDDEDMDSQNEAECLGQDESN